MTDTNGASGLALPRDMLIRAIYPGVITRADSAGDTSTLVGHFAVFNQWTEINSLWEGNFLERISPGAFTKTLAENRDSMRVLFQHGADFMIGDKPLGPIDVLEEDSHGARYEVPLLDTQYNAELLPGLREGLYGASFRFRVMREEVVDEPDASDYNPHSLPERTIKEARVYEFGPVTFPAYEGATAGVRSLTDEFIFQRFIRNPDKLRRLLDFVEPGEQSQEETDPPAPEAAPATTAPRRNSLTPSTARRAPSYTLTPKEEASWRLP